MKIWFSVLLLAFVLTGCNKSKDDRYPYNSPLFQKLSSGIWIKDSSITRYHDGRVDVYSHLGLQETLHYTADTMFWNIQFTADSNETIKDLCDYVEPSMVKYWWGNSRTQYPDAIHYIESVSNSQLRYVMDVGRGDSIFFYFHR